MIKPFFTIAATVVVISLAPAQSKAQGVTVEVPAVGGVRIGEPVDRDRHREEYDRDHRGERDRDRDHRGERDRDRGDGDRDRPAYREERER